MKKEYLILITAGIVIGALLLARKDSASAIDIIKPGDKGNDVFGLQTTLSAIGGTKISNMGAYDKSTLTAVQTLLKGSSALVDYDKGYVDRRFATDLYRIQNNSKNDLI
jgi:hypothetical protein